MIAVKWPSYIPFQKSLLISSSLLWCSFWGSRFGRLCCWTVTSMLVPTKFCQSIHKIQMTIGGRSSSVLSYIPHSVRRKTRAWHRYRNVSTWCFIILDLLLASSFLNDCQTHNIFIYLVVHKLASPRTEIPKMEWLLNEMLSRLLLSNVLAIYESPSLSRYTTENRRYRHFHRGSSSS